MYFRYLPHIINIIQSDISKAAILTEILNKKNNKNNVVDMKSDFLEYWDEERW